VFQPALRPNASRKAPALRETDRPSPESATISARPEVLLRETATFSMLRGALKPDWRSAPASISAVATHCHAEEPDLAQ
jgi:hypothetical protein